MFFTRKSHAAPLSCCAPAGLSHEQQARQGQQKEEVRTGSLRTQNRHETGSTTARSVDEIALIRDTYRAWSGGICVPVLSIAVPHVDGGVRSCGLAAVRPTRCGASKPVSRITRRTRRGLARTPAKRIVPIICDSPPREGGKHLFAGGYDLPVPRPNMRRPDQGDR